ncbi:MAG: zinc carboxypeptidase [Elusimicrobia bacterium]|nr:zinc carboxypeptidase [Elusimicrobiota bacterium]
MTKVLLSLFLAAIFVCPVESKGNNIKENEEKISFHQLLQAVSEEYVKNPSIPDTSQPKVVNPADVSILAGDNRYWVTIYASDKYERTKALEAGLDIVEISGKQVSGIIHAKSIKTLEEKGFVIALKMTLSEYAQEFFKDFPPNDSAYHNYDEMIEVLQKIADSNKDIASLFSIGKSIEGREIWTLRINSSVKGTQSSSKPGAVFMGAHHAREHLSVEVPLLYAVWLLENRNNPDVKKYIDTLDIYIMPMVNPDGAEYDISTGKYKWQRKNMRVNPDGEIGVDLNRNYAYRWGGPGASHSTWSDTYCGPAAFSEPETQAIKKFVEERDNLKTLISYHSYSELVLYPWGGVDEPIANEKDRKVFITMAQEMAKYTGYKPQQSSDLYVATGDTTDWTYAAKGIFSFTFEITPKSSYSGGFYPGIKVIEKTVTDNIKSAMYLLSVTHNPYSVLGK